LNEIAQASGVGAANTVARYLDLLQQMRLVTRRVPASEHQPEKSKRGLYQIDDHFLRFWFRYVHPNQSSLSLGLADAILEQRIRPDLGHFVAGAFEEASRKHIAWLARQGQLPFLPERIGAWWERDAEIDVLAVSRAEGQALVGECKWSQKPAGTNVLEQLKQKAQALSGEFSQLHYALFSRSGFTPALEAQAQNENVALYRLEEIVRAAG
jgi:uncharacterized protein